jgi:hypothetical protein
MEHYLGLDVSMEDIHIWEAEWDECCSGDKDRSSPEAITAVLETAPACEKIVLETSRMAPMLLHGLAAFGRPVICIESGRLTKSSSLWRRKRPTARCLWEGPSRPHRFFKPVYSSPCRPCGRALIIARKKLVGQRVT